MASKSKSVSDTAFDRRRSATNDSAGNSNGGRARRSTDSASRRPSDSPAGTVAAKAAPKPRATRDGRQPLVVYMRPESIKALKIAALEDDTTASAIVAAAVASWLDARIRSQ